MKNWKLFALILSLVLVLSLVGCAAASKMEMSDSVANGYGSAMAPESSDDLYRADGIGGITLNEAPSYGLTDKETASTDETTSVALPENRKMIQTFRISAETEDLDALMGQLNARISEFSGYVEGQNIYNGSAYSGRRYRNAELTVRIPADNAESFISQISEISNVVSSNKTVEDITLKYVSTESRMKALQTEEARLLELLAKAESMDDLLTIERYLTDVRTELEQVTSSLRVYDNRVDYATIYLTISEVKEYTVVSDPETVGERISAGFQDTMKDMREGFEDFIVDFVVNLPYILIWAAVIAAIIILIVRGKKKRAKKKASQASESE